MGAIADPCPDFKLDPAMPETEDLWEPDGAAYYNGELILQGGRSLSRAEQLEILDTHPLFTGRCPNCQGRLSQTEPSRVHWDCPDCGWVDDSV